MTKTKGWTDDRFKFNLDVLRREGLVWVDKKTKSKEYSFYFPSMLNKYVD
jgi:hypothetical protein